MADDSEEEDASGDEDLEEGVQEQEAAENGSGDENKDDDDDDENYGSDDGDDSDDYGGEDSDYIYDDDGEEGQIIGPGGDADRETQESVVQEDEEDDRGCAVCGCRDDDDLNAGQVQWVFCDFCDSWLHSTCDRRNDGSCQLEDKVNCCAACKKKLR